ncbi:GntR family transcriptional regulator [Roseateles toxinivorans]|uniref:GntR family transcriptional regulator n=1 Tax=Roseateles toxinivorans TaxID=270368 RepID=A0A4R6QHL6_9BURK|nr:GntR family transcriptional regulator [Roseateles toxinivorans]
MRIVRICGLSHNPNVTLYENYADEIGRLIASGTLRAGDPLPSVRQARASRGISASTVFQAYHLLEARGLVRARPRSGYFVLPRPLLREAPPPSRPLAGSHSVAVSELVFEVLSAVKSREIAPLGSAFPSPELFPLEALRRAMNAGMRKLKPWSTVDDLPPGHEPLRRQIARRYLHLGMSVTPEQIVLSNGALDGLNLCLQAVTKPGDAVVVESPCFYAALQALERLGLKAIEVATDSATGIDLAALARLLERRKPQAVWLMTSFQNPLGSLMPNDKKRALVELLARHQAPLIEDDVYAELYHGDAAPLPAKAFDTEGLVLHCSSFSKSLAPGYRVGWALPGRYAERVARLKLMTSLSGSIPAQAALAEYLQDGAFDRHLAQMRRRLQTQQQQMLAALEQHFPAGTRLTRPLGGYFVWVELPPQIDALALHRAAARDAISLAPGPMFSARAEFRHCLRLNTGHPWTPQIEQAIATLGRLAHGLC